METSQELTATTVGLQKIKVLIKLVDNTIVEFEDVRRNFNFYDCVKNGYIKGYLGGGVVFFPLASIVSVQVIEKE